jgi:putative phosphoesterase
MALSSSTATPNVSTLRRVAVIGDIHCEDKTLSTVLRHFRTLNVDATVAVGDIVDGDGDASRACKLLVENGVSAVMGNHDRWFLENRVRDIAGATPQSALEVSEYSWLEHLPKTISFETPRGRVLLCHGMGEDDMNRIYPDSDGYEIESNLTLSEILKAKEYSFVINGHTHEAMVRRIQGLTIINGGSLCRQPRPVCSVVDFEDGSVQFFEITPDAVLRAERVVFDTLVFHQRSQ